LYGPAHAVTPFCTLHLHTTATRPPPSGPTHHCGQGPNLHPWPPSLPTTTADPLLPSPMTCPWQCTARWPGSHNSAPTITHPLSSVRLCARWTVMDGSVSGIITRFAISTPVTQTQTPYLQNTCGFTNTVYVCTYVQHVLHSLHRKHHLTHQAICIPHSITSPHGLTVPYTRVTKHA
jgi:hypothetical protein